jgi:hypothetical protein
MVLELEKNAPGLSTAYKLHKYRVCSLLRFVLGGNAFILRRYRASYSFLLYLATVVRVLLLVRTWLLV